VNRLYGLCQGDLRLLRDLFGAVRERGMLTRATDSDEWTWRGPVPVTATVRERTAQVLARTGPEERESLERLAFAEPLAAPLDDFDLDLLERLETEALIRVDEQGAVRLAHPLHGPRCAPRPAGSGPADWPAPRTSAPRPSRPNAPR